MGTGRVKKPLNLNDNHRPRDGRNEKLLIDLVQPYNVTGVMQIV